MGKSYKRKLEKLIITEALRSELCQKMLKTGLSPRQLVQQTEDLPAEYDAAFLVGVLSGEIREVSKDLYTNLKRILEDEKDETKRMVPVTQKYIDHINAEIERTGIKLHRVLKMFNTRKPASVTVYRWIEGKIKKANASHLCLLSDLYSRLPDGEHEENKRAISKGNYKTIGEHYLPIDEESKIKLQKLRDIGLLPGFIFSLRKDCPGYLNASIISSWLNKENRKADPNDVEWVLVTCEEILEETLALYR